jgi:hypothetical protein
MTSTTGGDRTILRIIPSSLSRVEENPTLPLEDFFLCVATGVMLSLTIKATTQLSKELERKYEHYQSLIRGSGNDVNPTEDGIA